MTRPAKRPVPASHPRRAAERGLAPSDRRMPAHTQTMKNMTTVPYISCKLGTLWKGQIRIALRRVRLSQKRPITVRKACVGHRSMANYAAKERWPPYFSCSNAGMLMFQPMACLSNPQVKRLHTGWSSLHAEQHTILLWPYYQSYKPELVRYS